MSLTRRATLLAPLAIPALLAVRPAAAQTRWQMATAYADGNFMTRNIAEFIRDVERATGGKLSIQLHSNASLLPMPQIKRGVQQGQVQLGEILLTAYSNEEPFFDADAIPLLVKDLAEARKLGELQKPFIDARLQRQGLMALYMVGWPPGGFYTQVPLTSMDVLKGSRFRTFSPLTNRFAALIGANPVLVQSAEVAQAFATGIATAMVTSAQTGVDTSAWDYAKHFTPVNFTMTKNAVLVSRRAFEALPADQKQAVQDAAKAAEERGWRMAAESDVEATRTLQQRGLTIGQPPAEVMAALRQIGRAMADEWAGRVGEDGRKLIDQLGR